MPLSFPILLAFVLFAQSDSNAGAAPTQLPKETPAVEQAPLGERASPASSADQPVPDYLANAEPPKEFSSGSYSSTLASLLLVLGIILTLAYLVKRFFPDKLGIALGKGAGGMRLLQSLPLGQRRFLTLVEVDGRRFLIGVTDTQINLIKALDESSFGQELAQVDSPKTVRELMDEEAL